MRIEFVNPAATYGVACELARRNIRPHVKQIGQSELHYETTSGATVYLHVAGKQGKQWPLIELPDIPGGSNFLVLVDFEGKATPGHNDGGLSTHPDFYVLGREDWVSMTAMQDDWKTVVDGQPYYILEPWHVASYRGRWDNLPR